MLWTRIKILCWHNSAFPIMSPSVWTLITKEVLRLMTILTEITNMIWFVIGMRESWNVLIWQHCWELARDTGVAYISLLYIRSNSNICGYNNICSKTSIHFGQEKMAAIMQMAFWNAFCWICVFIKVAFEFFPNNPVNNKPAYNGLDNGCKNEDCN